MTRKIIALAGSKGSGKTTAFNAIKQNLDNVQEIMLAGLLKKSCCQVFNLDPKRLQFQDYKEVDLDDPIILNENNLVDIVSYFTENTDFDKVIRPHIGVVLYTPRQILQYIGTDVLHLIDPLIHTKAAVGEMGSDGIYVVTDLRFEDEFNYFNENHNNEFFPFYIQNENAEMIAACDMHKSEKDLKNFKNKCIPINNTNVTLERYKEHVISQIKGVL
jgi:energy-coupling factor transporter ATP-binding protein EcfA2